MHSVILFIKRIFDLSRMWGKALGAKAFYAIR